MGLLQRWKAFARPEPGPFPCAWCREEQRHDMCTGKAVRPHVENAALFAPRRAVSAVEDCSCHLAGHRP